MKLQHILFSLVIGVIFLISGCSGGSSTILPGIDSTTDKTDPAAQISEHGIWGTWGFSFDQATDQLTVVPVREPLAHFNITSMLTPPVCDDCLSIEVVNWDQVSKQINIKATLKNKTNLTAYDVRGIVMSGPNEVEVANADAYTTLWDDGGQVIINPFNAFAENGPNRAFMPNTFHSRTYEIHYPSLADLFTIQFVVDVSWPSNCREPYAIDSFQQSGDISIEGGSAQISCNVYDWQFNVEKVFIDATPIGGIVKELTYVQGYEWSGTISTPGPVSPGSHKLLLWATSAQTTVKLYNYFEIPTTPCAPDGNETWQTASDLPPGQDSGSEVVCLQDKEDWYKFSIAEHISGNLRLELLNDTGKADLTLYSNPAGPHLRWIEIEYGADAVIDMSEFAPGVGTFYIRVRHIGSDPEGRDYILYNSTLDSLCYPSADDTYAGATFLPQATSSGTQLVCKTDKEDWYWFILYDPTDGKLELTVTNFTGFADITLYSEAQAPNPDGPKIKWKLANPTAVIDIAGLGLTPGKYYIRVRHIGNDDEVREYILANGRTPGWVRTWGSINYDNPAGMDILPSGDIITAGQFKGQVDFNTGPGVDVYDSGEDFGAYITRHTQEGDYVWGIAWFTEGAFFYVVDTAISKIGDIYIVGILKGVVDLDPGPGTDIFDTGWSSTQFISKFDSSGNYQWSCVWLDAILVPRDIILDNYGNIYVTGNYWGEADFDPGPGNDIRTSTLTDSGDITYDAFLTSLDPDGQHRWVRAWGGKGYNTSGGGYDGEDWGETLEADPYGGVYVLGRFWTVVDFDPGPGISEHNASDNWDVFLSKFDMDGNFEWVKTWGNPGEADIGFGLALDPAGYVYVSGRFTGNVDLNPFTGDPHTSVGSTDVFISSFGFDGDFNWGLSTGSTASDSCQDGLSVTPSGDIIFSGYYNQADFDLDPGINEVIAPARPSSSLFIIRLNHDGAFIIGSSIGASNQDGALMRSNRLKSVSDSIIFNTGIFAGTVDFDAGPGLEERTPVSAQPDVFLMRLAGDLKL